MFDLQDVLISCLYFNYFHVLFSIFLCPVCFADMRRDVQEIFKMTPHDKQVMMFSATLSKEIRPVCKKFMQDVMSHGQYYLNLEVILFHNASFLQELTRYLGIWWSQHCMLAIHVVLMQCLYSRHFYWEM